MPARRSLLTAVAGATATMLAGCLASNDPPADASPSSAPSPTPTPVSTPPGDCSALELPDANPSDHGVESLPYPDLPSELDDERAATFAKQFERAWWHNDVLDDRSAVGNLGVTVLVDDVAPRSDGVGFVVTTSGEFVFDYPPGNESGTATSGLGVLPTTRYLVTGRFALRTGASDSTAAADGTLVACSE
ncbi:hypothetical protein [Halomarina rubra]|uniref:Lipoprotein n=1 Tax=Halomarina rubra TaxID=2071873 RepID=A0ABD6ARD8_9EURY|nr:hypothetical protein [Halomarina rubra]